MIHYLEFIGQDGTPFYQRADDISTFLVHTVRHKGKPTTTLIHLLLRNNLRLPVRGETLNSLREKLVSATGQQVVFHDLPPEFVDRALDGEPEEEAEAA